MLDPPLVKDRADFFRCSNRARADQYRAPGPALTFDRLGHLEPLLRLGGADPCRPVAAPRRPVQRDPHDVEAVDRPYLACHLTRGSGHSRQSDIASEQALIRQSGKRFTALRRLASFLYLD